MGRSLNALLAAAVMCSASSGALGQLSTSRVSVYSVPGVTNWPIDWAGNPKPTGPGPFSMTTDGTLYDSYHGGDAYVTGRVTSGVLSPAMAVWRYDKNGALVWVKTFNAADTIDAHGVAITTDAHSPGAEVRIYATGVFDGAQGKDIFTVCLNASTGATIWSKRYNNSLVNGDDYPVHIKVRTVTNTSAPTKTTVYVGGDSKGGTYTGSSADYDYIILKLDGDNGSSLWGNQPGTSDPLVARYDGPAHGTDHLAELVIPPNAHIGDGDGAVAGLPESEHIYATGVSAGYLTSKDYATIRVNDLNPYLATDPIVVARTTYAGDETGVSIGASFGGDLLPTGIYVTGFANNGPSATNQYLTIAYDAGLSSILWSRTYNNSGAGGHHFARRLSVGPNQSVIVVTGDSWGGSENYSIATTAYDTLGNDYWPSTAPVHRYDHPNAEGEDRVSDMTMDKDNNVYIAGKTFNGSTFDFVTYSLLGWSGGGRWSFTAPPAPPDYPAHNGPANGTDVGGCIRIASTSLPINDHNGDVLTFGYVLGHGPSFGTNVVKYGLVRYCQNEDDAPNYNCRP